MGVLLMSFPRGKLIDAGRNLLAAVCRGAADAIVAEMDNQTVHGKRSRPEELDEPDVSVVAEAMLGLVPPSPESDQGKKKGDDQPRKKRRKSKVSFLES